MQRSGVRSPRRPPKSFLRPKVCVPALLCYDKPFRWQMVLSDRDIKRYISEGKIKISPELPPEQFGSCSVDFRLGREFNVFEHSRFPYIDLRSKVAVNELMRE